MNHGPSQPPTVLTRSVPYVADSGILLEELVYAGLVATTGRGRPRPVDSVLLESVDIATKASRTTIAVLESSTHLTCQGQSVIVEPLPQAMADGRAALVHLRTALEEHVVLDEIGRAHV